jgi:carboxynorspermidine decarboxylase
VEGGNVDAFGDISLEHLSALPTPCYVVNEVALERNLQSMQYVQEQSGAKILLALKGFAMWSLFPLVKRYLVGTTASSTNEALLGKQKFGGETHIYAAAFSQTEFAKILGVVDHITFNSMQQWLTFGRQALAHGIGCAIRINPEHSEVKTAIYDPCIKGSRLGVTLAEFEKHDKALQGLNGLHFHTLCEGHSDALERTVAAVEQKFGRYFKQISWMNFGGGHSISHPEYDKERLIRVIQNFKQKHTLNVYLEPGQSVGLNTGVLITSVLDIVSNNGVNIAILDTSATAHMPDVLEYPYRPQIFGGADAGVKKHTYRLGGMTCLAGDVIGDWSFDAPLKIGDRLMFGDMAHYTMVKNTMFNGINLPSIAIYNSETHAARIVREFGYEEYVSRLS